MGAISIVQMKKLRFKVNLVSVSKLVIGGVRLADFFCVYFFVTFLFLTYVWSHSSQSVQCCTSLRFGGRGSIISIMAANIFLDILIKIFMSHWFSLKKTKLYPPPHTTLPPHWNCEQLFSCLHSNIWSHVVLSFMEKCFSWKNANIFS